MNGYEWWESGERVARWHPKTWYVVFCIILVLVQGESYKSIKVVFFVVQL